MAAEIRNILENSPLFAGLDAGLLDQIAASASTRSLSANEILFQKGDRADAVWGVLSGRIVAEVQTEDGKELVVETFGPGDLLGEVGVLDFGPRHVTAAADCRSKLFRLDRKRFLEHLQSSPELCFRVIRLLCDQLRETTESLEDTALYKLANRLAKKITSLAEARPENGESDDALVLTSQAELARHLGVNREAINRHLRDWEKRGWVRLKKQAIEICDRNALDSLAAPTHLPFVDDWELDGIMLPGVAFTNGMPTAKPGPADDEIAAIMAVDCARYSSRLMTDAAGTLRQLHRELLTVNKAIADYGGTLIWHTGDRILAKFAEPAGAVSASISMQRGAASSRGAAAGKQQSLLRIGIHCGRVQLSENRFLGNVFDIAIHLTSIAEAGDILVTEDVRDALRGSTNLEMPFIGKHEIDKLGARISIYSARALPRARRVYLQAQSIVPQRTRRPLAAAAILSMALALLATTAGLLQAFAPPQNGSKSVVVMPFDTVDDDADYLGQGLAEEIRGSLAGLPGFLVFGGSATDVLADRQATPAQIADAFGADLVLRGTLERAGETLIVSAELLDPATGNVAWSDRYQQQWQHLARIRDNVVTEVALSIDHDAGQYVDKVLAESISTDAEAHALFLEARRLRSFAQMSASIEAVPLLTRAIEIDPGFAEACALLADIYAFNDMLDVVQDFTPARRTAMATELMRRALELKGNSPFVLAKASRLAFWVDKDAARARSFVEAALKLNANDVVALTALRDFHSMEGNDHDAANLTRRLLALEPMSLTHLGLYSRYLRHHGRFAESRDIALRALALYPKGDAPMASTWLAVSSAWLGDKMTAVDASRAGMPYGVPFDLWAGLDFDWSFVYKNPLRKLVPLAYDGQLDRARQVLITERDRRLAKSASPALVDVLVNLAVIESLAGNAEESIRLFERAREERPSIREELMPPKTFPAYASWATLTSPAVAIYAAYRRAGLDEEAKATAAVISRVLSEVNADDPAEVNYFHYVNAQRFALDDKPEEALAALSEWRATTPFPFEYVGRDPMLAGLQGIPAYKALVADVEAELAAFRAEYHTRSEARINRERAADNRALEYRR